MNIIEIVSNKFLDSIFPAGIKEDVLIGQIYLDIADQVSLSLHVTQSPAKIISKWGEWGKDYNIIVIKVLLQFLSKVEINNWQNITTSSLIIEDKGSGIYSLKAKKNDWSVIIDFKAITFQRCDVYIK